MTSKKIPQSYFEAHIMLGKRDSLKVCNNTYLRKFPQTPDAISLILYDTEVVIYKLNSFILNSGGWSTMTTRRRINEALPDGWGLWSKRSKIYLGRWGTTFKCEGNLITILFHDGIRLDKLPDGSWFPMEELKKPEVVSRIIKQKCLN